MVKVGDVVEGFLVTEVRKTGHKKFDIFGITAGTSEENDDVISKIKEQEAAGGFVFRPGCFRGTVTCK